MSMYISSLDLRILETFYLIFLLDRYKSFMDLNYVFLLVSVFRLDSDECG
jgi:hypothetical protein